MSIMHSVRNNFAPIHPEGYPFIAIFFILSLVLGWLWDPLFWFGLVLTVWCSYFFRDPERVIPIGEDQVTSPADGRISFVGKTAPPEDLGLALPECLRISVFMSVFDCHVNRAPVTGAVKRVIYCPGQFFNAELDKASKHNERNGLVIAAKHGEVGIVQVAGLIARRIVCWAKEGDEIVTGKRFGLIRFGSRLDIYLPPEAKSCVSVGQLAIAGETVLAAFDDRAEMTDFRLD